MGDSNREARRKKVEELMRKRGIMTTSFDSSAFLQDEQKKLEEEQRRLLREKHEHDSFWDKEQGHSVSIQGGATDVDDSSSPNEGFTPVEAPCLATLPEITGRVALHSDRPKSLSMVKFPSGEGLAEDIISPEESIDSIIASAEAFIAEQDSATWTSREGASPRAEGANLRPEAAARNEHAAATGAVAGDGPADIASSVKRVTISTNSDSESVAKGGDVEADMKKKKSLSRLPFPLKKRSASSRGKRRGVEKKDIPKKVVHKKEASPSATLDLEGEGAEVRWPCPDGVTCASTDPAHYFKYQHTDEVSMAISARKYAEEIGKDTSAAAPIVAPAAEEEREVFSATQAVNKEETILKEDDRAIALAGEGAEAKRMTVEDAEAKRKAEEEEMQALQEWEASLLREKPAAAYALHPSAAELDKRARNEAEVRMAEDAEANEEAEAKRRADEAEMQALREWEASLQREKPAAAYALHPSAAELDKKAQEGTEARRAAAASVEKTLDEAADRTELAAEEAELDMLREWEAGLRRDNPLGASVQRPAAASRVAAAVAQELALEGSRSHSRTAVELEVSNEFSKLLDDPQDISLFRLFLANEGVSPLFLQFILDWEACRDVGGEEEMRPMLLKMQKVYFLGMPSALSTAIPSPLLKKVAAFCVLYLYREHWPAFQISPLRVALCSPMPAKPSEPPTKPLEAKHQGAEVIRPFRRRGSSILRDTHPDLAAAIAEAKKISVAQQSPAATGVKGGLRDHAESYGAMPDIPKSEEESDDTAGTVVVGDELLDGVEGTVLLRGDDGQALSPRRRVQTFDEFNARYVWLRTEVLGKGGMATVYAGKEKSSGEAVAIKVVSAKRLIEASPHPELERENLKREVDITLLANHSNVIKCHGIFYEGPSVDEWERVYFVLERLSGGSLADLLRKFGRFEEHRAKTVMHHVLHGLRYLHAKRIVHRDIKLTNVLAKAEDDVWNVRIVDFGIACIMPEGGGGMSDVVGSLGFMAPEALSGGPYTQLVDMWSLGVVVYALLFGKLPIMASTEDEMIRLNRKGTYSMPEDAGVSGKALAFVRSLMCPASHRMSATDALQHPWIRSSASIADTRILQANLLGKYLLKRVDRPTYPTEGSAPSQSINTGKGAVFGIGTIKPSGGEAAVGNKSPLNPEETLEEMVDRVCLSPQEEGDFEETDASGADGGAGTKLELVVSGTEESFRSMSQDIILDEVPVVGPSEVVEEERGTALTDRFDSIVMLADALDSCEFPEGQ